MLLIRSMAKDNRDRNLTLAQQLQLLKARYSIAGRFISPSIIEWIYEMTPLPLSDTYVLKIRYEIGHNPKTFIVSPYPLKLADGADKLPHTFDSVKQLLCLYHPSFGEWDPSMAIADTIVHWAASWIVNYEAWVITGKWLGGGHGNWDANISETPRTISRKDRIAL